MSGIGEENCWLVATFMGGPVTYLHLGGIFNLFTHVAGSMNHSHSKNPPKMSKTNAFPGPKPVSKSQIRWLDKPLRPTDKVNSALQFIHTNNK